MDFKFQFCLLAMYLGKIALKEQFGLLFWMGVVEVLLPGLGEAFSR